MLTALAKTHTRAAYGATAEFAGITLAGALLSIMLRGFIVGPGNNFFHLPIVMGLYDAPQFAQDAYIQSLRNFNSILWALFPKLETEQAIAFAFLFAQVVSRWLFFIGFLLCASLMGLESRPQRMILSVLLAITPLMVGTGYAGNGGLFIGIFTHSEVNNGLALICLYFAVRQQWIVAFIVNAIIFNINAFMAIWNALPLAAIFMFHLKEGAVHFQALRNGSAASPKSSHFRISTESCDMHAITRLTT